MISNLTIIEGGNRCNNEIQRVFNYGKSRVRIVIIDGDPWFVLNDVCCILEITNPRNVAARLPERMRDAVHIADGIGRMLDTLM